MTSRLKHKLELENVNLNSAYLNESFVSVGTPLPALASTRKDKLEYVPEWQQEVRDDKGRRRFHGAWTGGFSAGYFNTAGSKEGWAPSEFKSSRNNRANRVQRPEDFMDEEDLQQMNDDRQLENTDTFKNEAFAGERQAGPSSSSALESLIAPAKTSIGEKLLQTMGWRPGQGIGPRVSLRKLRIQEGKLGRQRAGLEDEDEPMDAEAADGHTFAPRDVKLLVYRNKEDKHGLGYEKGRGMGPLPGKRPSLVRGEDDDDDFYGEASAAARSLAFDHGDNDDEVVVMGEPSRTGESRDQRPAPGGSTDRWHDGRPVLPGFTLDPLGVPTDKWFAMPDIPPDWRPRPARVWGTTRKFAETPVEQEEKKDAIRGAPGRPLTFEQRGVALGEEQRISKAKSVFEYMSEKERERLASLAAAAQAPGPPPLAMDLEAEIDNLIQARPTDVVIPPLSPRTASAALQGFIPYNDDPARQDRYRSYLSSQTYNTKTPDPVLKTGSVDEINKELDDFAASARIFKPMSFAMSNRFTSGSSSLAASDLKQAKPGLHIYDAEKFKAEAAKPKVAEPVVKKNLNPREQAAENGMYGKMTRETRLFYPIKLLCKRIGVPDPHPEGEPKKIDTGASGGGSGGFDGVSLPKNDASWEDNFIHQPRQSSRSGSPELQESGGERQPKSLAEVGMADDVNQGRDILSYTKPSIDIFKAIFASDDEDDDDEDEDEARPAQTAPVSKVAEDPYPVKEEGPVDIATFKPVFSLKREEKKKKSGKKEKKRKGVLSFDVGEDGEEDEADGKREERKKKRKEEAGGKLSRVETPADSGEDGGEWVEKELQNPRIASRKGAADFM